jgi:GTP-binding protein Era
MTHRSGVVAVVGRPNVGKSTLVNALVGEKVAIVSDKPQTTRRGIRGIRTDADAQIVFVDTPGFHKPRTLLGRRLNDLVGDVATGGVDAVLLVVDAAAGVGRGDAFVVASQVVPAGAPCICAVNKTDRLRRDALVPQLAATAELGPIDEIVPISAATGEGLDVLLRLLVERLPEGPQLYPDGEVTDQSVEDRIADVVREQALARTREEVPHSVAVVVDEIEREGDLARVHASIVVERDSQKGILIGAKGATLKAIGTQARPEIERLLGSRVFLDLRVKVLKEWQQDPRSLERLGF